MPLRSQLLGRSVARRLVTKEPPPTNPTSTPLTNGSSAHRNLKKGLVSASEVSLEDLVVPGADEPPPDLVSVIRFPPPIAALLRLRLAEAFRQQLEPWREGGFEDVSARGPLGLSITPTTGEDYRLFDVAVDLMQESDIELMKEWRPNFDPTQHPPQVLTGKAVKKEDSVAGKAKAKARAKPRTSVGSSSSVVAASAVASDEAGETETAPIPIATVHLKALLVELPTLIEAYKTLDLESMIKSADISQMLVAFFPEDEAKYLPCNVTEPGQLHMCAERVQSQLEQLESTSLDPEAAAQALMTDLEKLRAPRCPWLWPSGITPPTHLHRERRTRDLDMFTRSEVQSCEVEMLSLLKRGRTEHAHLEAASAIEAHLQDEALRRNASLPNPEHILCPTPDSRITRVFLDGLSEDPFEDPKSDFSDSLFEDEPVQDERQIFEDTGSATAKRRREKRTSISVVADEGVMIHRQQQHTSLESEFNELAQVQVRQQLQEDLEAEFEADFAFGMDSVVSAPDDGSGAITSMRKIDRSILKKKKHGNRN